MKHLLFVLLLFPLFSQAQKAHPVRQVNQRATANRVVVALDQENGFGEYQLGYAIAHFPQLELFLDEGENKIYKHPYEQLAAYGVPVIGAIYKFTNGKLASISFDVEGQVNSDKLKQELVAKYGPAKLSSPPLHGLQWQGKQVMLSFDELTPENPITEISFFLLP
jgi:hypothetical protein